MVYILYIRFKNFHMNFILLYILIYIVGYIFYSIILVFKSVYLIIIPPGERGPATWQNKESSSNLVILASQ